jgi:hypothetical protein
VRLAGIHGLGLSGESMGRRGDLAGFGEGAWRLAAPTPWLAAGFMTGEATGRSRATAAAPGNAFTRQPREAAADRLSAAAVSIEVVKAVV